MQQHPAGTSPRKSYELRTWGVERESTKSLSLTKDWELEADYKPNCAWIARTKWYGERDASQKYQDFLGEKLLQAGAVQS